MRGRCLRLRWSGYRSSTVAPASCSPRTMKRWGECGSIKAAGLWIGVSDLDATESLALWRST
jgi:hypothetical protein